MTEINIKPWFKEDIQNTVESIYFTKKMSGEVNEMEWIGFLVALAGVMKAAGIALEAVMTADDIELMTRKVS